MAVKQKILLVEDDDALAEVAEQLALHEEFELSRVETAAAALAAAGKGYDLILLDVGLTGNGRETCKTIRKNNIATPIIMLTGAASKADFGARCGGQ